MITVRLWKVLLIGLPSMLTTCAGFEKVTPTCPIASCSASFCSEPNTCDVECALGPECEVVPCRVWGARKTRPDADLDGVIDAVELQLAKAFFPRLNMHTGTYEGIAHGSYGQFYGGGHYTQASSGARVPFVVRPVRDSSWQDCDEKVECIEIIYGLPYSWDLGDDVGNTFGDSVGGAHRGDSEMYAVLVRVDPGVSWMDAQFGAQHWVQLDSFVPGHMCTGSASYYFKRQPPGVPADALTSRSPNTVWVAEGKNAGYFTQADCNSGGAFGADDCSDNRSLISRSKAQDRLQNAGARVCHPADSFVSKIAQPASQRDQYVADPATYSVWGTSQFGTATRFVDKLRPNTVKWRTHEVNCW